MRGPAAAFTSRRLPNFENLEKVETKQKKHVDETDFGRRPAAAAAADDDAAPCV
jgi:hypothetical protein